MENRYLQMNRRGPEDKPPLIIIAGPTAVGKTALSVELAKRMDGEIISADSMQVYRGMDIGTAKVTPSEMQGIPHHLIDVLDPRENFDAMRFQQLAKEAIRDVVRRGKLPILVGGTGFYIQGILYDIDFTEEDNHVIRAGLEKLAETEEGRMQLLDELRRVDPEALNTIHPNNLKRVIRAVEFHRLHGSPISAHNAAERQKTSVYDSRFFVLTMERNLLYERIDRRVDRMIDLGLIEEVKRVRSLCPDPSCTAMQAIGYKELVSYLDGECDLDTAVEKLKQNTRHFAKRQLTWFKREKDVLWIERHPEDDPEEILRYMMESYKDRTRS